ncbi:DegT/DnrJ/EryC1/StrS family aminotransferase [Candidatus Woesearchaeota archaeon]|nr:DegT/DnrJ/EryC1/StrS family aminotransferase [Candidatus Woesearchaeota archaeon]
MIPVCEPTLRGNELKYVIECVKSGWISSSGRFIKEFEEKFSSYCKVPYGISCSNGTAALHLAIESMGIGHGDEVIIPTFTMIASCNAVIYSGAKPVLVDSEFGTWNIDIGKIEEKITKKTKAIMVVHTYGHPVDMDKLKKISSKYDLPIIEDAAEAHGAEYKGKKTGSLGDIACFSFYGNKILVSGEGGMVVTSNKKWAENARKLRNHYFGEPRFLHQKIGYNYRMTNIQAAIGLAQLERVEELVSARRKNAQIYNRMLRNTKGITAPPEAEWAKNVYWMYGILVQREFGLGKKELVAHLEKSGVETRNFFIGMHKQPAYKGADKRFPNIGGKYPCSDELEEKGFYLPSSSHLTKEQIRFIVDCIKLKSVKNEK